MDVHCTTCGEPWDTYHLRFDAIYETDLDTAEAKAWTELSPHLKLLDRYREKFKASGFEFGGSIVNVMRCPACPKDAKPDPDKAALKAGIVGETAWRRRGRHCRHDGGLRAMRKKPPPGKARNRCDPNQAEFGIIWQLAAHLFRLRAGDVFKLDGRLCRVVRVNDCSAVVVMNQPVRDFKTRFDKPVRFQPPPKLFRISPFAEVEILNPQRA